MLSRVLRGNLSRSVVVSILLGFFLLSVSGAAAAFRNLKAGDQALPIAAEDLEGNTHNLSDYGDSSAILLFFWATWSGHSLKEMDDLAKLDRKYGEKGLKILAVNVENQRLDAGDMARIKKVIREKEISFTVLVDKGLKNFNEWGVIATPTTAVINRDGTVVFDLSGYPTAGYLDLDTAVRKELGLYHEKKETAAKAPGYMPNRQAMLHFGMGKSLMARGLSSKAIPEFQQAAEEDTHFPDPPIYLAYSDIREGNTDAARTFLRKAYHLDPERAETRLLLAHLLLKENRLDDSIELLAGRVADLMADSTVSAGPAESIAGSSQESQAVPKPLVDLDEALILEDAGKINEAVAMLSPLVVDRLKQLGFSLEVKKKLEPMERMKLMMQKRGTQ
ncbi:MAG TPA: redoxin domain-containing protein [Proteobacteria bacterium]|nr:thiol-disulfide oxidoreductase ResA [bacterium BMS3Abin14]HDL53462.1 redoxin domain-containing protein [Pseudomonadota bacterium]